MIRVAILANLVAYSIVASQPLAYIVFLGKAQRALSAPAYVELRQRINPVMSRRLPAIYLVTLLTTAFSIVLALQAGNSSVLVAGAIALVCLVVDVFLMLRASVPVNEVMDRWSTTDHPGDWEEHRANWFRIFGYRQVVLLVGFFGLLVGAVFQS